MFRYKVTMYKDGHKTFSGTLRFTEYTNMIQVNGLKFVSRLGDEARYSHHQYPINMYVTELIEG